MGLAADVGTLQRLPKVIGSQSLVNELCLTARKMGSEEAMTCGLVSKVYETKEDLMEGALAMAALIASKSPVAVQGTKDNLGKKHLHDSGCSPLNATLTADPPGFASSSELSLFSFLFTFLNVFEACVIPPRDFFSRL